MKRRKFLITSGSTILTGSTISSLQRPALGLEFSLSAIPDEKPSNVDSVLIKFTKFEITPQYLDRSSQLDISVKLDIKGEELFKKTASNISFSNGEVISDTKIKNRTGTDLSQVVLDNLDESGGDLHGDVTVNVNHPDIDKKSYNQSFTINKDTELVSEKRIGIIDDFENSELIEYSGDINAFQTQSSKSFNGSNALKSDTDNSRIQSISGLPRYPQAGDTFQFHIYLGNTNSAGGISFASDNSVDNGYLLNVLGDTD